MILADPRYGSERPGHRSSHRIVAEQIAGMGIEVVPQSLDSADFAFLGNGPEGPLHVGVELKTVPDFITSMQSGRMADQIARMTEQYQRTYVIVEGFYRARRGSGLLEVPRGRVWQPLTLGSRPVFWAEVERFVTGIEEAGVRVRRTRTSNETASVIVHVLKAWWDKDYEEHRSLNVLYRPAPLQLIREDEVTHRLRLVASCLPGIGHGRSKAVAQTFRSIYNLANSTIEAWEGIDGIGRRIAGDAVTAIHAETARPTPARTGRVSKGRRISSRGARHSGRDSHSRVAATRAAQRSVPAARASHRKSRRGSTE